MRALALLHCYGNGVRGAGAAILKPGHLLISVYCAVLKHSLSAASFPLETMKPAQVITSLINTLLKFAGGRRQARALN